MKTVIIVSKCLRVTNFKSSEKSYEFHFKGVYAGEVVQKVILYGSEKLSISKGEEYLMYIQFLTLICGTLTGKVIKIKLLDECWDRS